MPTTQQLQDFTQQVRRDILRMVHKVNSGHPGGSLGSLPRSYGVFYRLYNGW